MNAAQISRQAVRQFSQHFEAIPRRTVTGSASAQRRGRVPNFLRRLACGLVFATAMAGRASPAQTIDSQLITEPSAALAEEARRSGDPVRGAILFHQPFLLCTKCHLPEEGADATAKPIGPDLAHPAPVSERVAKSQSEYATYLVESVLRPSKDIRRGYEAVVLELEDGLRLTGRVDTEDADQIILRESTVPAGRHTIKKSQIERRTTSPESMMPVGLLQQLSSRQQFLDLIAYLIEIAEGGPNRALALKPHPSLYAVAPLPEYEADLDHQRLIASWNQDSYRRGEAIYQRVCANCHGTPDRPGSLPMSLKFAEGKFKNGSDPYSIYQTLTRGFGLMVRQDWMVPRQKYDVIHYVREAYLKELNPSQYVAVDRAYLAGLPPGKQLGPEPASIEPWVAMDYGPSLTGTYEFPANARDSRPSDGPASAEPQPNFAYKGIAVRLDAGTGGVSRGSHWLVFDHDTFRVAGVWSRETEKEGFIDWQGIHFDGRHNAHPHIVGKSLFTNSVLPGWANPQLSNFQDPRLRGRDGRIYGPLPGTWARFRGYYHHGSQTIFSYQIGDTEILESPGLADRPAGQAATPPIVTRTMNIGPRSRDLILQVATAPSSNSKLTMEPSGIVVRSAEAAGGDVTRDPADRPIRFDGATSVEVPPSKDFDLTASDFSITARIRTTKGGALFCETRPGDKWVPNGKVLFVRGGRLCYDIGWVGVVSSRRPVNDGKWHEVAMTWQASSGQVSLYIDGRLDAKGVLKPRSSLTESVLRIGYAAPNFPEPATYFTGDLSTLKFFQQRLTPDEVAKAVSGDRSGISPAGSWQFSNQEGISVAHGREVPDVSGRKNHAVVRSAADHAPARPMENLVAGLLPRTVQATWTLEDGQLRLRIPAGETPLRFTLWQTARPPGTTGLPEPLVESPERDLQKLTRGGPPRWPQQLTTYVIPGTDHDAFAVDVINLPVNNPWFAQVRVTGFDFLGDHVDYRLAVCTWDGDVWLVRQADVGQLSWQRIASGLFQPLGLKVVSGRIFVTCRDQLVVLNDLNGDGETDFYECFNHDHQVTEHFHEFAMGLQVDAQNNFYYAKSARHALPALVPHHGTLLRVSADGQRTDILANGFRAANGVCLNPDGSFIVTDQEGHWNPKNRINWVTPNPSGKPRFYGNMFGYHDVTDASDAAMEPPLCWITNAFDRSPAELLWVTSDEWGPLKGSLLNLSYGYGKIFIVPHERIGSESVPRWQGGMCELPLPPFPTGVMRGRFDPQDGQLYVGGMFAWAGNAIQPGGLYRVRYTGRPVHLPLELHARESGISITFSGKLDPNSIDDLEKYSIKTWSLKRTANYGSDHFDEKFLRVTRARLSEDQRTLHLEIPEIKPTWCMEIKYSLKSSSGSTVDGVVHNTIHELAK